MITTLILLVIIGLLVWYFYGSEGFISGSDYPGDDLPYDPSSDPFQYSGIGDVGYIGPDPVDVRIMAVNDYLVQSRSNVGFVRIDSVSVKGPLQTCKMVFMDDSTAPYGYQVTALLDMSALVPRARDPLTLVPTVLNLNIGTQSIDITNGLAAVKFTKGLSGPASQEQIVAAAIRQAIMARDSKDFQFVSTQSLTTQGSVASVVMFFVDTSDFPTGIVVTAMVDTGACPAQVVNLAYSTSAVGPNQNPPTNNADDGSTTVVPFTGGTKDDFFPFAKYTTIQQAASPDLTQIPMLVNTLGEAAAVRGGGRQ